MTYDHGQLDICYCGEYIGVHTLSMRCPKFVAPDPVTTKRFWTLPNVAVALGLIKASTSKTATEPK